MFSKIVVAVSAAGLMAGATAASAATVSGTGATFPAPIYQAWAQDYKAASGTAVNYQGIGSSGGIRAIKAKQVDFGATDKPLKPAELDAADLAQFPAVIGGVVPVVNLPGVGAGQVHLTGPVLGSIFLGDIKKWNDPQIASINPGVKLPGLPITVVHRSDGSGTSFLFTSYLSMVNAGWAGRVGANDAVQWPTGLGGKGNDGVAAFVKQTVGSIGYVEYAFAKQNKLSFVQLKNKSGQFVNPDDVNFRAAAAGADWSRAPGFYLLLLDKPGAASWPITGATFILIPRNPGKPAQAGEALKFFDWAFKNGDARAIKLDYVPLPGPTKDLIRRSWKSVKGAGFGG